MYKVLVTGGIGSGKTTACKMFEELGVPVFYSDEAARILMDNNPFIAMNIKKAFGNNMYVRKYDKKKVSSYDELDRKKLAEVVFNDQTKLDKLNKIVHPWVGESFESFCFEYDNWSFKYPDVHYVIEEAAIAIEIGIHDKFDYIVVVTASDDVRIERVMSRDKCTKEQVIERMNNQISEEDRVSHADSVINNDDLQTLEYEVKNVHEKILELIKTL